MFEVYLLPAQMLASVPSRPGVLGQPIASACRLSIGEVQFSSFPFQKLITKRH